MQALTKKTLSWRVRITGRNGLRKRGARPSAPPNAAEAPDDSVHHVVPPPLPPRKREPRAREPPGLCREQSMRVCHWFPRTRPGPWFGKRTADASKINTHALPPSEPSNRLATRPRPFSCLPCTSIDWLTVAACFLVYGPCFETGLAKLCPFASSMTCTLPPHDSFRRQLSSLRMSQSARYPPVHIDWYPLY
jgi:hypothetical protein